MNLVDMSMLVCVVCNAFVEKPGVWSWAETPTLPPPTPYNPTAYFYNQTELWTNNNNKYIQVFKLAQNDHRNFIWLYIFMDIYV